MKESVHQRAQNNETKNQERRKREERREKEERERETELKHRRLALLSIIAYRQAQTGQSEEKENTVLEGLE